MLGWIGSPGEEKPSGLPRWFGATGTASRAIYDRFHGAGVPAAIYHYTSVAALIPIATADELWLSDATFLNDRAEIGHGVAVAAARLRAAQDDEADDRVRAMLAEAAGLLASEPRPPVYVCCFSAEQDDLGQWRGYGRGAPVAMEFRQWQLMFGYSQGVFGEVRYDLDEQAWSFDQLIDAYRAAYRVDLDDPVPPPPRRKEPMTPEEERVLCAGKLHTDLWSYIVTCKDPAFASEREIRFVYVAYSLDASWFPGHPTPAFRETAGRIVPYLSSRRLEPVGWESDREVPTLPIHSVRIGPTPDQDLVARGVRRLLDAVGHAGAEVVLSGSPLRSW